MVYSVLTEPVIPVLMPDGKEKSIGIKEVFLEAHNIKDITGSNPLERYALLRLLIAFAMDMLHPETSYDRMDLLEAGRFDAKVLETYIQECEKNGPRFDLFDPTYPFMQSRYDEETDKGKIKNIANVCPPLPQGNNHVFIDHRYENQHSLSAAEAFRSMCSFYVFCFPVGAKGYPSGVNNTSPLYVIALGDTLFETIVFNTLSKSELGNIPYGLDLVPWKGDCNVIPKKSFANVSVIEAYTWMPRRITLICDNDGMVRTLYLQPGHDFKGNELWMDPHVPYKKNEDNSLSSIKPKLGKQLWRDVSSIVYDKNHRNYYQPSVLYHLVDLFEEESISLFTNIRIMGLVLENNAKYIIWYEDTLSLPSFLMNNEEKANLFRLDVNMIEIMSNQIYKIVRDNVDNKTEEDEKKKKKKFEASRNLKHEVATQCQQFFLQAAHDVLFGNVIREINEGIAVEKHYESFNSAITKIIHDTLTHVLYTAGNDTNAILRQMEAEKWIWIHFNKIIKERKEQYAGS